MNQLNIGRIEINDLFDELINENKRLFNELLFAQKCIKLLEKYRNYLNNIYINCKCDQNIENKLNFNDLEIEYKCVFDNELKLEINEEINNKFINNFNNNNKDNELIDNNSDKKPKINYKKKRIVNNNLNEKKRSLKSDKSDESYDQNEDYVNYRLNENKKTTKRCETLNKKKS
jgi:hypothetical protein